MWIATMDTEHFSFVALDSTEAGARKAITDGFLAHLIQYDGSAEAAMERFGAAIDRDLHRRDVLGRGRRVLRRVDDEAGERPVRPRRRRDRTPA